MDLGGWLRSLGLEQYEAAFRENAIDDTVLLDLTENHLREIGIPLGARLKLLKAIAALGARAEATSPSAGVAPYGPPIGGAEGRQVTVMFCDLVGSTALSARLDPEDLREVIAAYHKCAGEIVRRFGGFVSQYLGHPSTTKGMAKAATKTPATTGHRSREPKAIHWPEGT